MFYITVGAAALALLWYHMAGLALGPFEYDTQIVVLSIGISIYIWMVRNMWLAVNDAYATAILCLLGGGLAACSVVWGIVGMYPSAMIAAAALITPLYLLRSIIPRGIRMIRLVFGR